nr:reverse transcriptase [Tanacetum cinerariifolium]
MRPFGCPVTILNTLDPLGKVNRKAKEGFLVGYSITARLLGYTSSDDKARDNTADDGAGKEKVQEPVNDLEPNNHSYADESVGAEANFNNMEPSTVMDVKSDFLYGTIEEEVYVSQPLCFVNLEFPKKVYKVEKALYGLHQDPRAWTLRYLSLVVPLKKVSDEAVHKELGDRMERAATTVSSLEEEQDSEEITPMPHDSPLQSVHSLGRDEGSLSLNELTTSKDRRKAKIVISEDEDVEDPSKQGRSLIEEFDMDVDIALVPPHAVDQGRKSDDTQVSGNLKIISIADVSTASEMVNTTGLMERDKGKVVMLESEPTKKIKKRIQVQMSIDEELARKLHEEDLTRFNVEQEAIDIARKEKVIAEGDQAHDINWSDPTVIRYHTLQNRPRSVAEKFRDKKEQFKKLRDNLLKKKKGKKSDDSSKPTRKKKLARKRAGGNDCQESVKKQKLEDDTEKKELKAYLDIVPEDEFVMEVKSLATKANGSSKNYKIFSKMLDDFDRQDVMDLYRLVEESWRLCDSSGIHILLMDNGIAIHMLIEKKYPLGQEMISKMLNK